MLPNFFIVGAAKSGTSSLDRYLSQHPDIYIPPKKEAHFFSIADFPSQFEGPGDEGMNLYTVRNPSEYEQLFDGVRNETSIGESSVFYLYYPGTAKRIQRAIPNAKVIVILRNPVDRAFSAYTHLIRDGRETLSFEQSLAQEEKRKSMHFEPMWLYRELGLYSTQVKRYLDVFGREQVHVVIFEEFLKNPEEHLKGVLNFLGVKADIEIDTSTEYNESGQPKLRWMYDFISKPNGLKEIIKPLFPPAMREKLGIRAKSMMLTKMQMETATRAKLTNYFAGDIARLEEILERSLSVWTNWNREPDLARVEGTSV